MDFSLYDDTHFSLYDKYERHPARTCVQIIIQTGAGYCHHPRPGNETHATGEVAEMNNNQIKRAEMIAMQSIGNNPAAGNQWHETERKIQTVKPMKIKWSYILLLLAGILADVYFMFYVFGG